MHVIGGKYKGTRLRVGSKLVRPTSALVRKAVFDILGTSVKDTRFLDLYAGTGAMGLEALSRGATFVTFVEGSQSMQQCIRLNLTKLSGLAKEHYELFSGSVQSFIRYARRKQDKYHLAYIDPPYVFNWQDWKKLLSTILGCSIMQQGALFIAETRKEMSFDKDLNGLKELVCKDYGESKIVVFQV